jgi:hypothetical protein
MSDRKRNILEACERIEYYNQANPQLKTELPYAFELFTANQGLISRLNAAGIASVSATSAGMSGTRSKVARSREIHADLRLVRKTAKQIEKKVAGFQNTFILPHGRLSYQQLIEYAESFIADAAAYQAEFAKRGLTEQFFTDLAADVAEFKEAAQQQQDGRRTSVGATADTEAILEDALETRRELKTILENHYRNDPAKLAEWLTASHIERKKSGAANNHPPTSPPTP